MRYRHSRFSRIRGYSVVLPDFRAGTGGEHDMMAFCKKLWEDTAGQGLAEYALLLGMIVIGVIVLLQGMGISIRTLFTKTNSELETAASAAS